MPALTAELNQGDIFEDIAFIESVQPRMPLQGGPTVKGGQQSLMKAKASPAAGEITLWLAKGPIRHGMLLNHGCDLDKGRNRRCVLAPVSPLSQYPDAQHEIIMTQRSIPLMFLPDVPALGHMVADFRLVANVPRETINASIRVASMTEDAQWRVKAQIVKFYTRKDFDQLVSESA